MENMSIHSMHNMKIVTSKLYDPINISFTRYNFSRKLYNLLFKISVGGRIDTIHKEANCLFSA